MDSTITTPRLKLSLVTTAPRGSSEFNMIHELRSNEQSSFWRFVVHISHLTAPLTKSSLHGPSKSEDDTEKALKNLLPPAHIDGDAKVWKIAYAVHELSPPSDSGASSAQSRFIGLIILRSLAAEETTSPPRAGHASTATRLSLEVAYMFFPASWGKGYATESISAMLEACRRAPMEYWAPYQSVIVRSIVNDENVPSQRVMEKCGMGEPKVLEFEGDTFFIGGKWRSQHRLFLYGKTIVG